MKTTVCHRFGSPEGLGLLEAGKLTPVIDRQDELAEASAARKCLGEGHARAR